jgi:hypothetical protein
MTGRHQANRRRSYGRRQHELHERTDRPVAVMSWLDESDLPDSEQRLSPDSVAHVAAGSWVQLRGAD